MKALSVVAALALASSASARADTVPNRARDLAERGRTAHDAKDYATAIASFTEAYALAPAPGLLFNLAQVYRLRGSCDDAALMYRRFLATNPPDDARQLAEAHLSTVERCLAAKLPTLASAPVLRMPGAMPIGTHARAAEPDRDVDAAGELGVEHRRAGRARARDRRWRRAAARGLLRLRIAPGGERRRTALRRG
jgi:tetratricopeptide (TPR) repeat protein